MNRSPVHLLCIAAVLFMLIPFSSAMSSSEDYDPNRPGDLKSSQIKGQSAIVIDVRSGTAVFEKNADTAMFPASTTKIMTVMIALERSNPEDMVTVSQNVLSLPEDGSMIGLVPGEQLRMEDLLKATMVASGNDGALVIAEHIAGSQEAFAQLMNEKAQELGAVNSHFANPHGYHDDNHYSTARDIALITRAALQTEGFREIFALYTFTIPAADNGSRERKRLFSYSRYIMNPEASEGKYYYPSLIGGKSGSYSLAGECYAAAADRDGIELISVTLKSNSNGRWVDTQRLMDYGFSQYVTTSIEALYKENPKIVDISSYSLDDPDIGQLELSLRKRDPLSDDRLVGFADQATNWQRLFNNRTSVSLDRILEAPVSAGEVIGTLTYMPEDNGAPPVEYDLIAARSIERRPAAVPTLEEIIQYTDNDPNPFPRFSLEFAFLVAAPILSVIIVSQVIYKLITRRKKPKFKKNTSYKTRYYR